MVGQLPMADQLMQRTAAGTNAADDGSDDDRTHHHCWFDCDEEFDTKKAVMLHEKYGPHDLKDNMEWPFEVSQADVWPGAAATVTLVIDSTGLRIFDSPTKDADKRLECFLLQNLAKWGASESRVTLVWTSGSGSGSGRQVSLGTSQGKEICTILNSFGRNLAKLKRADSKAKAAAAERADVEAEEPPRAPEEQPLPSVAVQSATSAEIDQLMEADQVEAATTAAAAAADSGEIVVVVPELAGRRLGLNFLAAEAGGPPVLLSVEPDSVVVGLEPLVEAGMVLRRVGGQHCGAAAADAGGGLAFAAALEQVQTADRPLELVFGPAATLVAAEPGPLGLVLQRQALPTTAAPAGGGEILIEATAMPGRDAHNLHQQRRVDFPVIGAVEPGTPAAAARPALRPGMRLLSIRLGSGKFVDKGSAGQEGQGCQEQVGRPVRKFEKPYDDALALLQLAKRPVTLHFAAVLPDRQAGLPPEERQSGFGSWLQQKAEVLVAATDRAADDLAAWAASSSPSEPGSGAGLASEQQHSGGDAADDGGPARMGSWSREKLDSLEGTFEKPGPMGLTFSRTAQPGTGGGEAVQLSGIAPNSAVSELLDTGSEGARLVAINGQPVAGLPFDAVIGLLKSAARPTRLALVTQTSATRASASDVFPQSS